MAISRIEDTELVGKTISELSDRPTDSKYAGGDGLTSAQLKERYDALPKLVKDRLNALIDALTGAHDEDLLAQSLKVSEDQTLADFITAITAAVATKYDLPATGIPASDLSDAVLTLLGKADTALQEHQDISGKADKSALEALVAIVKGKKKATVKASYSALVTALNAADDDEYIAGDDIYVLTQGVPDVWISGVEDTATTYTYTTDEDFIDALIAGTLQVGYYTLAPSEAGKPDLTGLVTLAALTDILSNYAKQTGNYETLGAGHATNADNLTPYSDESGTEQDAPFISQGTGTANNTASVDTSPIAKMLVKQGNTVVKNQLVQNGNFDGTTGWSAGNGSLSVANNIATVTASSGNENNFRLQQTLAKKVIYGHKGLFVFTARKTYDSSLSVRIRYPAQTSAVSLTTTFQYIGLIATINASDELLDTFWIQGFDGSTGAGFEVMDVNFFDLTAHFNGNDNIPQDLLDNPDHWSWYENSDGAYDAGSLVNANGRYLVCTGRQLWDEEWELGTFDTNGQPIAGTTIRSKNFTRIVPNTTYYFRIPDTWMEIYWYDGDKNFIKKVATDASPYAVQPAPSNAVYFKFRVSGTYGSTYKNDITISLYYSPEEGGEGYSEHYPYEEPKVYDTGTEQLLKVGSAVDDKVPNGTVTRRNGTYTFTGSETFYAYGSGYRFEGLYGLTANEYNAFVSDINLPTVPAATAIADGEDGIHMSTNGYLYLSLTAAQVSGKTIYYELATPTTEQGTTFPDYIDINDYGMMYWLDTDGNLVGIPQGIRLFYPVDYKAFIDTLNGYTNGDPENLLSTTMEQDAFDAAMNAKGYYKQEDLSTEITDSAGLTYSIKKLYKSGNVITLSIKAKNETASSISADTELFTMPNNTYISSSALIVSALLDGSVVYARIGYSTNKVNLSAQIPVNSTLCLFVSYAIS